MIFTKISQIKENFENHSVIYGLEIQESILCSALLYEPFKFDSYQDLKEWFYANNGNCYICSKYTAETFTSEKAVENAEIWKVDYN